MRMYIKNLFTANEGKRERYRRQVLPVDKVAMAQGSPISGSTSNHTEISKTLQLLKQGEEKIQLSERYKNVTLVLGNTGAGKTTFLQWIAGNNDKLIAKEVSEGAGEYIIEDGNRIGSSIESKTIFPELVVHTRTDTAYYDCPGFSDTRSTSIDIAATYFVKKVADHAEHVKMIFVVSHPSVRIGVDRQDFMKLLRHATDFIKDIDKYENSIAIMVTKIDSYYDKDKVGKGFILRPDEKIIETIGGFLQEVKQGLEKRLGNEAIFDNEKKFYENAIKFVNTLLIKDGKTYTRIGLFRRPDEAGPLSNITLLQEGKEHIDSIIYENLVFTSKNNGDFGYTISDKSKNDISALVEGINDNVWSNIGNIVKHMQEHYRHSVEEMRSKISSFATSTKAVDADQSEARKFVKEFNAANNITTNLIEEVKHAATDKLAEKISHSIPALRIDGCEEDMLGISKQGKFFEFLQVVSDNVLSTRKWDTLLQPVATYLSGSGEEIQGDINDAAGKINNQINATISGIAEKIEEHYRSKMSSMEIQQLPDELNKGYGFMLNMTQEFAHLSTAQALSRKIRDTISHLDIDTVKIRSSTYSAFNLGKYLAFLQIISNKALDTWSPQWIAPFNNTAKYLNDSNRWYVFLDNLYKKLSAYEVQEYKSKYNVANIEDWGQENKLPGISVTRGNFRQFLAKVKQFGVEGYNAIENIEADELHVKALEQVARLTLGSGSAISCESDKLVVKRDYIKFSDFVGTDGSLTECKGAKSVNIFALHTLFIDKDLKAIGNKLSVTAIAPRWEVRGSRKINLSGSHGQPHHLSKANNGKSPGSDGEHGKPGLSGGSAGSFFGIDAAFFNGNMLTIMANGGNGGNGQEGGDGAHGSNGTSPSTDPEYYKNYYCRETLCKEGDVSNRLSYRCDYVLSTGSVVGAVFTIGLTLPSAYVTIYGKEGQIGGKGGNGRSGGVKGKEGDISIISLGNASDISIFRNPGSVGTSGSGGLKGSGGRYGDTVIMSCYLGNLFEGYRETWTYSSTKNNGVASSGNNGMDGANGAGIKSPEPAAVISNKAEIINAYKSYLRENLPTGAPGSRFKRKALLMFSNQLDGNSKVKDAYGTQGLFDELQGLEEQFHLLINKNSNSPGTPTPIQPE